MRVDVGGIGIEYEVTGEGRPVVLLHGFPDSGRLWRNQVPALAQAGFKVIVPDLRGYGRSDKPAEVEAYAMAALAGDVAAVLSDAGASRAHVVGHDWGAAVAWALAAFAPDHVDHLAVLSVGHPATFRAGGFEQYQKSWYMLLFQFKGIAEKWLSNNDWAHFRAWAGHPDADAVIAELEVRRLAHARAQLLPSEHPAGVVAQPRAAAAADPSPHDGRVELGRHGADRAADDELGRERRRSVALRATRRARPLDAARGAR